MAQPEMNRSQEPDPQPPLSQEAIQPSKRISRFVPVVVSPDAVSARLQKGAAAADLPENILVLDTGQPEKPASDKCQPQNQKEVDALYLETIEGGIVDHHGIDAAIRHFPIGVNRLSATGMIARFPEKVARLITERDVDEVTAHTDCDADSICSSYLAKAIVENGVAGLPHITSDLGEHLNLVDYGRFSTADESPESFLQSFPGVFAALKETIESEAYAEAGKVWARKDIEVPEKQRLSSEIGEQYDRDLIASVFEVLNSCEATYCATGEIDFGDISASLGRLSESTRDRIDSGRTSFSEKLSAFEQEFEAAIKTQALIRKRDGALENIPLVIFDHSNLHPIMVGRLCETRCDPETIVAVFQESDASAGGDRYNIRIRQETTDLFDLKAIELPLNEAEAEARAPELERLREKKLSGTLEESEQELLQTWETLRRGFEHCGHGDPTVCVAGGSLIAASRTSRLDREGFLNVLKETFGAVIDRGQS